MGRKDKYKTHIEPNLSYLFPTYPYGSYNSNPIENFQLIPLYDVSLETYVFNVDFLRKLIHDKKALRELTLRKTEAQLIVLEVEDEAKWKDLH